MKLLLDPLDLKTAYQNGQGDQAISTRNVTFATLNDQAQRAVRVVGRATFHAWDGQTYNAIYPPVEEVPGLDMRVLWSDE